MNRRSFLTLAIAGSAGMVLDPERLLWVPGQKSFVFLQPPIHEPTLGELVALTWEKVMAAHGGQVFWHDPTLIRHFARESVAGR